MYVCRSITHSRWRKINILSLNTIFNEIEVIIIYIYIYDEEESSKNERNINICYLLSKIISFFLFFYRLIAKCVS